MDSDDIDHSVLELPYLPLELWGEIFGYLRLRDLSPCSSVCLTWERADLINQSVISLNTEECRLISYKRLQKMVNLYALQLDDRENRATPFSSIVEQVLPALQSLVNLRSLDLSYTRYIGDETIRPLTNLTILTFTEGYITGDALNRLPYLNTLWIGYPNTSITNESLGKLTNLTDLAIFPMKGVRFDNLCNLTNLQRLHFSEDNSQEVGVVSDELLRCLPNLVELNLDDNNTITGKGLQTLSKLEILTLDNNYTISSKDINGLTTLRTLYIGVMNSIYLDDINERIIVHIDDDSED